MQLNPRLLDIPTPYAIMEYPTQKETPMNHYKSWSTLQNQLQDLRLSL